MKTAVIVVAIFLVIVCASSYVLAENHGYIIVYGSHLCPACKSLESFFKEQGIPYVFRDVSLNESYANDLYRIVSIAKLEAAVPTSAVMVNGRVVALVQGAILNADFWKNILNNKVSEGKVYIYYVVPGRGVNVKFLENKSLINSLNNVVTGGNIVSEGNIGLGLSVLPVLFSLAIADSINPCAIVFLAIIITSIAFTSKARRYAIALAYVLGVYSTYFTIGVGLSFILSTSKYLLIAVAIFGYSFVILGFLPAKSKWLSNISSSLKKKMLVKMITKYSIPISYIIGSLMAITFMMCSSAPYFIFLAFLNRNVTSFHSKITYVALYNTVIVTPLILTALASSYIADKISGKHIRIARDILLLVVSTYALYATLTL